MKVAMLGATSGMGRAIAQRLAARGESLFLLGAHEDLLAKSAADLKARHPQQRDCRYAQCDLEHPEQFAAALDAADRALHQFDCVIVTAGMFATQAALEADIELTRRLLTVNFANTIVFCEHVRKRLLARGGGRLVVFSSVAGDRGRKPVALYGPSKAGLATYLEAIDHKFHAEGLSVLCVKPGFVKTSMTAGLKVPPFAGEPGAVADQVIGAIDRRRAVVYAPPIWRLIMFIIRQLPRAIMRRIGI